MVRQDWYWKRKIKMALLEEIIEKSRILYNEPMKKHTTFRIGGPAKIFVRPETTEEIKNLIAYCKEQNMEYFLLGNGSNLLVSDAGFDGMVIQIFRNFSEIHIEGNVIEAQSGALLSAIAGKAAAGGLGGMEFAAGIPGTAGGAVFMNAGAYGGEMKQIIRKVEVLDKDGQVQILSVDQLELGYRTSIIKKKGYVVLRVWLLLEEKPESEIREKMEELKQARISKQPLEYPSAGSTFKRPEGYFAGKLIMDAGLRGFRVGDAQIAEKHCGFVINRGNASAAEVLELVEKVQAKIKEENGVTLEMEVQTLGF